MTKLTDNMVKAITEARYNEKMAGTLYSDTGNVSTGYTMYGVDGRTLGALKRRGLAYGDGGLTAEGVNVLAELSGNKVDAAMMSAPGVEITDMPSEPEFNAPGASECYFGCGRDVVAVFVDYVGRTEGLCSTHRDRVEGETYNVPTVDAVEPENGTQEVTTMDVVAVIQNTPGMAGETHYHSPGCRDIAREMKRWGQKSDDALTLSVSSVVDIIAFEDGGRGSDYAEDNTQEWWDVVAENAGMDEVKIMSCLRDSIPSGSDTLNRPLIMNGGTVKGFGEAPVSHREIATETAAKRFPIGTKVRTSIAAMSRMEEWTGTVELHTAHDYNGWFIPAVVVKSYNGITRTLLVGDLENDVYEVVPDAPRSTGTTHHSLDSEGKSWTRFDHVLTVGDVVKVIGEPGTYVVYALIPGLPVVYVQRDTDSEPFPMGATKVYAL